MLNDKNGRVVVVGDQLLYPDRPAIVYQVSDIPGTFAKSGYCYGMERKKSRKAVLPSIIQAALMVHEEDYERTV